MYFPQADNWLIKQEGADLLLFSESGPSSSPGFRFGFIPYHFPQAEKNVSRPVFFPATVEKLPADFFSMPARKTARLHFKMPEREKYIETVQQLKRHIARGDIYEINYCVQFTAANAAIDPAAVFQRLDAISHAPHSCLARFGSVYIICASPERFLQKKGSRLITQPIKGTAPRGRSAEEDERLKEALRSSPKERAENVMTVDVSRHDLSRIAKRGTVKVDELCGIYSFAQVHQMISTVSCELAEGTSLEDILDATFPMASMTGAPKHRAMQLIEACEQFERGFYSGSIGVVTPGGDFDLNVVIRSVIYDQQQRQVSFAAGSAITALSDPEQEWEECLLKARAMMQVLGGDE